MLFKHLIFYAAFARLFEDSLYLHLSVFSPLAVIPFIIYASMGEDYMAVNALSYLGSVIPLYSTCILFYNYQINVEGFQFLSEYYLLDFYINTSNSLGLDGLSFFFFALTALIFPFCIMSSLQTTHVKKSAYYVASLLALESILLLAFSTTDLFVFYVAFEAVLIPMFFIIGVLGSGRSRVKAAYYFFFYTLIGSIFFSLGIFTIYLHIGSTSFLEILNAPKLPWDVEILLFFTLGLGFSVKMPLFPFHTWLPEAHVQAPTEGSVILASLLLKLGGYGIIRLLMPLTWDAMDYFRPVIFCISVCGIFFCSLSAIIQVDLKKLIAYSSVAHMNLVALGLFSLNIQGIQGAIFLMIAHGLVSSGLFFLVGFLYTRYGTRNIERYCGLVQVMPLYTVFFFIFMLANVGFPITCNFVGELLVLIGVAQRSYAVALIASFSGVFCVAYSFIAFNRIAFLNLKSDRESYKDLSRVEFTILFSLASLIIVLGIKPGIVLSITDSFINNFFRSI